jgi:S-formylglutathione hydrolase FrmB
MGRSGAALVVAILSALVATSPTRAGGRPNLTSCLAGQLVDFTHNHGSDYRICFPSLGLRRDVYVYLPPGYDPRVSYPLLLWLHGFGGDETQFVRQVVFALDQAILTGKLPPVIAVAPDGSIPCTPTRPWKTGSWFINSRQGNWEDYIMRDVLGWAQARYKIRAEREARIIAGWSMGGFGAYNLGFKHPDEFHHLVGVYPDLNLRYVDCHGHWGTDFDPNTVSWLTNLKCHYVLGFYPRTPVPIPAGIVYKPAWGMGRKAIGRMSRENPLELLDRLAIQPGQFDMYVAYGGKDEYNIDAQIDSFLHRAGERGFDVWVRFNPAGHHSTEYVNECMPDVLSALGTRLRELLPDLKQGTRRGKSPSTAWPHHAEDGSGDGGIGNGFDHVADDSAAEPDGVLNDGRHEN